MSPTQYLKPKGVAERMNVCERTVQRIFAHEPGVLRLSTGVHGRIRIPLDVLLRVEKRLASGAGGDEILREPLLGNGP